MTTTIGPFDNVPDIGAPIRSDWPQEASTVITGLLARQARYRYAVGPGGSSGGALAINSVTFPAGEIPVAGVVIAWTHLQVNLAGGTSYEVALAAGGVTIARRLFSSVDLTANHVIVDTVAAATVAAGAPVTIAVNGGGAANVTTFNDPNVNLLHCLYVPAFYAPT